MLAGVHLVDLWQQVPPLLSACLCDDLPALRVLRLVDKESSRSAMLGLKSYTITLVGTDGDTTSGVANLLQQARLHSLGVSMRLSGEPRVLCNLGRAHLVRSISR